MKYKLLLICTFIIALFGGLFLKLSEASASTSSYYNEKNAPEFYGLTKAVIQKGDSFKISDAKYRIFARDFEDGDLTNSIIIKSNNVDSSKVGNYKVIYEVVDSHKNKTALEVSIEVIDEPVEGRYYERTLYSLPSVENMSLVGTNRGNNHDRQMLGIYMEKDSKISIKKISGDKNLTLTYLNNDSLTEKNFDIKEEYVDITSSYDGVPFIKTIYESSSPVVIGIKENDSKVHSLNYYHFGDDESSFFEKWESLENSYAVVESEDLTVLVPYYDRSKLVNYYNYCFKTLDDFFMYWDKVIDQYDEYLGLSYNPEDSIDQNVKTRYFVKANKHGAGAAYYAWDHVGVNSSSVASFFEVNWGGLHEVGHGYQGSLKNDLDQGEVSNNILGYYVQRNKNFFPYSQNWLGEISDIEDKYQALRLSGKNYFDLDLAGRLYFVVNLLDYQNPKETYAEINKIWRRATKSKQDITSIDAYTLAFYNLYKINIAPYFDIWSLSISDSVKEKVSNGSIPSIIYDVSKEKSDLIKKELSKLGKYSLISNEELSNYSLIGNLNVSVKIDDLNEIKGKKIILKNESYSKEIVIIGNNISLNNIPVGTYEITLPVPQNNIYEYQKINYVTISDNITTNLTFNYKKDGLTNLTNDSKIELRGLGDQLFADMLIRNGVITITNYNVMPHVYYNGFYASVEIYDLNNQIIYSKTYNGDENNIKEIKEISFLEGYKIVIIHKEGNGRLIVKSTLLNESESNLTTVRDLPNTYIIGNLGLYQENQDYYQNYLNKIDAYAEKLINKLSESELLNKNLNVLEKRKLLLSILKLNETEKNEYLKKYKYIYNGSSPKLTKDTLEIKENEKINLYKLLEVEDLEDGVYTLNSSNFKFDENLLLNLASGKYKIPYEINDSDGNITTGFINLIVLKDENNIEPPKEDTSKDEDVKDENSIEPPKEDISKDEDVKDENSIEPPKEDTSKDEDVKDENSIEPPKEDSFKDETVDSKENLKYFVSSKVFIRVLVIGIVCIFLIIIIKMRRKY